MIPGVPFTDVTMSGRPIHEWERSDVLSTRDDDSVIGAVCVFYKPTRQPRGKSIRGFEFCAVEVKTIVSSAGDDAPDVFDGDSTRVSVLAHGSADWDGINGVHFGHAVNNDANMSDRDGFLGGNPFDELTIVGRILDELVDEYCRDDSSGKNVQYTTNVTA